VLQQHRELKMTVVCKACENQYGAWRPRCPTCGTSTPIRVQEEQRKAAAPPRAVRERQRKANDCILCRRRVKNAQRCPHCDEPIHRSCLHLHGADCAKFQVERVREETRLNGGANA
jgi:hypothetical protein